MSALHAWEDSSLAISPSPAKATPKKTPVKNEEKENSLLSQYLEASTVLPSPSHPWESPLSKVADYDRGVEQDMMVRLQNLSKENHELRMRQNAEQEKVKCLVDDVKYLKEEAARLRQERNTMSEKLRGREGRQVWPSDLEEDLSDARADIKRLKRERDELTEQLRSSRDPNEDMRELLRRSINDLREEHETALRDLRATYDTKLRKSKEVTDTLARENDELRRALEQATNKSDAHRENIALKRRLDEITCRVEDQAKLLQSPRRDLPRTNDSVPWSNTESDASASKPIYAKQDSLRARSLPPLNPVFEPGRMPPSNQSPIDIDHARSPSVYNNKLESPRGPMLRRPSPLSRRATPDPETSESGKVAVSPPKSPSRSLSPHPNGSKADSTAQKGTGWPQGQADLPRTSIPSLSGRSSPSPQGQPLLYMPKMSESSEGAGPRRSNSPTEIPPPRRAVTPAEGPRTGTISPRPESDPYMQVQVVRRAPTPDRRYDGRRSPPPVFTPSDEMRRGARVVRNPAAWKWEDQDGGAGNLGTAIEVDDGWVVVAWDATGRKNCYRWGHMGIYDVTIVPPHETPRAPSPRTTKTSTQGHNPALGTRLSPRPLAPVYTKSPHPSPKGNLSPSRQRNDVPSFSSS